MGSGSEVQLAVQARETLAEKGIRARVVSMPCREWFDQPGPVLPRHRAAAHRQGARQRRGRHRDELARPGRLHRPLRLARALRRVGRLRRRSTASSESPPRQWRWPPRAASPTRRADPSPTHTMNTEPGRNPMSERLKALADAGVSIWLDDLSRERIETGNLADLVKNSSVVGRHHQPDDLRQRALRRRAVRRPGPRARPGRARTRTRRSSRSPPPTCATPATCSRTPSTPPAASTAGSRSRSPPAWPTTRGDHRVGQGAVGGGRPGEPVHQDPGDDRGRARRSPTCSARASASTSR